MRADTISTGHNPIIELAKITGTPLHQWKENALLVGYDGQLVANKEVNIALRRVWEVLERAMNHSTNHSREIHSSASLYSYFQDHCKRATQNDEMTTQEAELVLGMSQMWGAYVGDCVEVQSLKYFYLEDCIDGGR